jgi:hypothetical protein
MKMEKNKQDHLQQFNSADTALKLCCLHYLGVRQMEHVACMGEMRNVLQTLVRTSEGKRLLGRPRHRWKDIIGMDIREIGWEDMDRIHLAQVRDQWLALMNTVMNPQAPQKTGIFLTN